MSTHDRNDDDRIVISLDDLAADPPAAAVSMPVQDPPPSPGIVAPPPVGPPLPPPSDPAVTTRRPPPVAPGAGPPQPTPQQPLPPLPAGASAAPHRPATANSGIVRLSANSVVSGLVAGTLGGILGMLIAENLKNPSDIYATTQAGQRFESGVWVALAGLGLGFVLMAWDGFTSGSAQKGFRDGAIGAGIGAIAGFIGGYLAQWIFSSMLERLDLFSDSRSRIENMLRISRMIAWACFGTVLGGGLGVRGGPKKIVNGLIGGAVGGAVAGLVFQQLDILSADDPDSFAPFLVRLIGFAITGAGVGLGVGLVERIRRDSWLYITSGPMTGKEYILYNDVTSVGSDYRCDIVLVKDQAVASRHAVLTRDHYGQTSVRAEPGASVLVNGAPVATAQLRSGDTVTAGQSSISYQERG